MITELILQRDLRGLISWGKNYCTEKNIYLTAYNAEKNMLHHHMSLGKKFYLHRRFVGKKSYPNQIKSPSTHQVKWSSPQERKA